MTKATYGPDEILWHDPHASAGFIMPWPIVFCEALTSDQKLLAARLYDMRSLPETFPSQQRLSLELKISIRSVERAISALKNIGMLDVIRMGRGKTNRYRIGIPAGWAEQYRSYRETTVDSKIRQLGGSRTASQADPDPPDWRPETTKSRTTKSSPSPSEKASLDLDALETSKPAFRYVVSTLKEEFDEASPGGRYHWSKNETGALKKLWDDISSLEEARKVIRSAGLLRETDPFWAKNWSVRFVLSQVGKLLNAQNAPGEVEYERSRVEESIWASAVRAVGMYGVEKADTLRVLRKAGYSSADLDAVMRFTCGVSTRFWCNRFLGGEGKETRLEILEAAAEEFRREPGKKAPAGAGEARRLF